MPISLLHNSCSKFCGVVKVLRVYLNSVQVHSWQYFVNDTHVLRESVKNAAGGVGVKEPHRSAKDVTEHLVVKLDRAAHAHP